MQLSSLEEYGIRCALQLAKAHDSGPMSASTIASKEGLSTEYASKIMHLFRKANIVSSARGNQGGFFLSRSPGEIKLKEVFDSLDSSAEEEAMSFCDEYRGKNQVCPHNSDCGVRPVWQLIFSYMDDVFKSISLGDLVTDEKKARLAVSNVAVLQAKKLSGIFGG